MKTAVLTFVLTLMFNSMPANANELRIWPGKRLSAGEQALCMNIIKEQQFLGGSGDVLRLRFDSSVEGSVSLDGGTIAEFKYDKGQVSAAEIRIDRNELAVGRVLRIGIRVGTPVTVGKDGFQMYTINTSRIVGCPAR